MRSNFILFSARLALFTILVAAVPLTVAGPAAAEATCQGWMMGMPNYGFEDLPDGTPVPKWCAEGPDVKGVDRGIGWSYMEANDAYIEATSTSRWNAIRQNIIVPQGTIELSAYAWTSDKVIDGYFGVRIKNTGTVYREIKFGPLRGYQRLSVLFPAPAVGANEYTAFIGYWSPGGFSWLVVDEFHLTRVN